MERRKFLTIPLAAMAAPGAILAAGIPARASVKEPVTAMAPTLLPAVKALKGASHAGTDALALRQIKSLNLGWYYSWGSKYTVTTTTGFVPMIRSAKAMDQGAIKNVTSQLALTKAKNLLGFNEPDVTAQANMSVDQAIRLWPQLQATGLRLGSPATAKPSSVWLEEFMAKAKKGGLRVDFVTMHCYAWPNAEDFLNKVTALHDKYGKPVWVTEYAVADWSATSAKPTRYSRTQIQDFMRATVAGMREMPFVERFAWKTRPIGDPVMGASALYSADGTLTSTGRLYASL